MKPAASPPEPFTGRGNQICIALERGEVVYLPKCPFPIPQSAEHAFLLQQRLGNRAHKNISYDPRLNRTKGYLRTSDEQANHLHELLRDFSKNATDWLSRTLPRYAASWRLDQVTFRPEEEATRKLRLTARNDLLHVDAFPNRPTNGHRILRLFVNINPTEPRVWITTHAFAKLFELYGSEVSSNSNLIQRVQQGFVRLFKPGRAKRSVYDSFMLRFHNFLKANEEFQRNCEKKTWYFPPFSTWLAITDTASHAVLSGRAALEHSYFLNPASLALPDESPAAILSRARKTPVLNRAA